MQEVLTSYGFPGFTPVLRDMIKGVVMVEVKEVGAACQWMSLLHRQCGCALSSLVNLDLDLPVPVRP